MSENEHLPAAWPRFLEHLGSQDRDSSKSNQAAFAFQARWRFAKSFAGLQVEQYKTPGVVDGYHALLKVLLVCTAWEQLAVLLGKGDRRRPNEKCEIPVVDDALLAEIRESLCPDEDAPLSRSFIGSSRKDRINKGVRFMRHESDSLVEFAFALRDGVAHGTITPSGSGLKTAAKVALVNRLSDRLLSRSDELFAEWVDERVVGEEMSRRSVAPAS